MEDTKVAIKVIKTAITSFEVAEEQFKECMTEELEEFAEVELDALKRVLKLLQFLNS